jgi:hypothetical protein
MFAPCFKVPNWLLELSASSGQFEHEILREAPEVAPHLPLELFGLHPIELGEVAIQHHLLPTDHMDAVGNGRIGRCDTAV